MNYLSEFIMYKWNAKGRHGLHSPFVYEIVDRCFQTLISADHKQIRQDYSARLSKDHRVLSVVDAGAGSKHFGSERTVAKIFRISATKGKYANLLYRLVQYYKPSHILELGTSLGSGTLAMALANPASTIQTIEACPQTLNVAREQFERLGFTSIQTHNTTFSDFLEKYTGPKFDFVFIDGHHDGEALKRYLEHLKEHTHDETFFILDDIRWSVGMKKAFDELVKSQDYHVSIDLFRVGILLPRKIQEKEHFVLEAPQ